MACQPLISVIVPVYKVEPYLDRCVQSIVDQTYSNLEIILVDDGSPDNCPAMCDAWARRDNRIRVIHKANGGGAQARNVGIENAHGDYISFVDSDDFLLPGMYETLYRVLLDTKSDIAECGFFNVNSDFWPKTNSENIEIMTFNAEEAVRENIMDRICRQLVWNKLYRTSIIGKIRFVEGKFIDDEFFTYQVLGAADQVAVVNRALYCYRQQAQSAMHQVYSLMRLDALEAKLMRVSYVTARFPNLIAQAKLNLWFSCIYAGQMVLRYMSKGDQNIAWEKISSILQKCQITIDFTKPLNSQQRWLLLAKISLGLVCRLRNLLGIGF